MVEEVLGFEPAGEGGHMWLWVRKRNANTEWCARRIAALAGARPVDVGFAGLKDRHALTTQWFSVDLRGRGEPDWSALAGEGIEVLRATRGQRKLRRGVAAGNRFVLRLDSTARDTAAIEDRVREVAARGVPNYFGAQRFGREGGNLVHARALLLARRRERDRHRRGLYLSAARSLLFNQVLARRVAAGDWDRLLPGEVVMLDGSRSIFAVSTPDSTLVARAAALDVHPTGPLWGDDLVRPAAAAAAHELGALEGFEPWCAGLERARVRGARRALRVAVRKLDWEPLGEGLQIRFDLPAGAYATVVLRELFEVDTR